MSYLDWFKKLNREGKRKFLKKLRANNRAKTRGAFGTGPFEKYASINTARSAKK